MTKLIALCMSFIAFNTTAQEDVSVKNYQVKEFNRINTYGGGNVSIGHSDTYTIEVRTSGDCMKFIEVFVLNKTLSVKIEEAKSSPCTFKVDIGLPALEKLVQNGGGNIVLEKGFSDANAFECGINGGGTMDVSKLPVDFFFATVNGGGTISLNARKQLKGNISGGGLIEYSGDPVVTSNVSGGGAIRRK